MSSLDSSVTSFVLDMTDTSITRRLPGPARYNPDCQQRFPAQKKWDLRLSVIFPHFISAFTPVYLERFNCWFNILAIHFQASE